MTSKSQAYQSSPKYITDFSKALAGEMRILLAEVGKLRDEKRQLQYEIAELLSVKSKFGAGGEYMPEWQPQPGAPPLEPPPAPPAIEGVEVPQARPGWRTVTKRAEKKPKVKKVPGAPAMIAPPPAPAPEPPRHEVPAWAQWRPNPLLAPTPVVAPAPSSPPPRSGLFGPATPPPK